MTGAAAVSTTQLAPAGSFQRAEQEILLQGMRSSFAEKLQWLEEACDFADALRDSTWIDPSAPAASQ